MRQKMEAPANPKEKQLNLDYTEVELHLRERVAQLEHEGMSRKAALRTARREEDQDEAVNLYRRAKR